MAFDTLKWCVTKVHGLFSDVERVKQGQRKADALSRRLEAKVDKVEKVQVVQGREAELLKNRVIDLESQNDGLKISRGRLKAKLSRTQDQH